MTIEHAVNLNEDGIIIFHDADNNRLIIESEEE